MTEASSETSVSSVVTALGPGSALDALTRFAPNYEAAQKIFNQLLRFPHLEAISLSNSDLKNSDPPSGGSGTKDEVLNNTLPCENLRELVIDGSSRFVNITTIDVRLARTVISYSDAYEDVLTTVDVATFVEAMESLATGYADEARGRVTRDDSFYSAFKDYIRDINSRIEALSSKLTELDGQIEAQSKELDNVSVGKKLFETLKSLFNLSKQQEQADIQIASLLNTQPSVIAGDFLKLFEDRDRLDEVLTGLKAIRKEISELKTAFTSLSGDLTTVIKDSSSLVNVWDDLAKRMETVKDVTRDATPDEVTALARAWKAVEANASKFINVITGAKTSMVSYEELKEAFSTMHKVPQTQNELALHQLLARVRGDPHNQNRVLPNVVSEAGPVVLADNGDEEVVDKVIGPPAGTQEKLNEMALNTGRIIKEFDTLLQQPNLEQLSCVDPLGGKERTNVFNMVTYYRKEYLDLQIESIPLARDLQAYSNAQMALLPMVAANPQSAQPGDITMQEFLDTNAPLTNEYLEKASKISEKTIRVKNDWNNAINVIHKTIGEFDQEIGNLKQTLEKLTAEKKKSILFAVLGGLGALATFAAGAFIPGGMMIAMSAGGSLGGLAVEQIIKANKTGEAISTCKKSIETAENSQTRLKSLLPLMQTIAKSLSEVSNIWSDIATALTKVDSFYKILGGPTGKILLDKLRPKIIEQWQVVYDAATNYIKIVVT